MNLSQILFADRLKKAARKTFTAHYSIPKAYQERNKNLGKWVCDVTCKAPGYPGRAVLISLSSVNRKHHEREAVREYRRQLCVPGHLHVKVIGTSEPRLATRYPKDKKKSRRKEAKVA